MFSKNQILTVMNTYQPNLSEIFLVVFLLTTVISLLLVYWKNTNRLWAKIFAALAIALLVTTTYLYVRHDYKLMDFFHIDKTVWVTRWGGKIQFIWYFVLLVVLHQNSVKIFLSDEEEAIEHFHCIVRKLQRTKDDMLTGPMIQRLLKGKPINSTEKIRGGTRIQYEQYLEPKYTLILEVDSPVEIDGIKKYHFREIKLLLKEKVLVSYSIMNELPVWY